MEALAMRMLDAMQPSCSPDGTRIAHGELPPW
jgi:hypothetical protein